MTGILRFVLTKLHYLIIIKLALFSFDTYKYYVGEIKDADIEKKSLTTKIKKQKKILLKSEEYQADLINARDRVKAVADDIKKVQLQLPEKTIDTEILDMFSEEAKQLNIKNVQLSPLSEENRGFYYAKRYKAQGKGTFLQFLVFFENIGENDRLLNVRSLSLKRPGIAARGRFQIIEFDTVMEAFRFNPGYRAEEDLN